MTFRLAAACAVFLPAMLAGDKKTLDGAGQSGNDDVEIAAAAMLDHDSARQALGADLGAGYLVVRVTVSPKNDKAVSIGPDDFTLLSHKDGQRSQPFAPSQIAGKGGLVLSQKGIGSGGMRGGDPSGPVWGGIPGTGGRPRQGPGSGGGFGNSGDPTVADVRKQDDKNAKDNPLLAVLQAKVLPDKESSEPVSGLLYFPLEGKHKAKDISLIYKGPAGRLVLEFRDQTAGR